jgi:hypothetical protein
MKTYGEWLHAFLTSALGGGCLLHAPAATLGKGLQNPLDRRMDGPQSWSGCDDKEKNFLPLLEIKHSRPAHSLVTILTELFHHPRTFTVIPNYEMKQNMWY